MRCAACTRPGTKAFPLRHPRFRHLDFGDFGRGGSLRFCPRCACVFNPGFGRARKIYESRAYGVSRQTHHTIRAEGFPRPMTRSRLQAELLAPLLKTEEPAVLDIGCFDGLLLKELAKKFPRGSYCGQDVNAFVAESFPKRRNFRFTHGDLSSISGRFDLVCLSHSIVYLPDLAALKTALARLLKPGGLLFIQAPDYARNPCTLLLADQRLYLDRTGLAGLLRQLGFSCSFVPNRWFPRELVAVGRARKTASEPAKSSFSACLSRLDARAEALRSLPRGKRVGVLGTTVNAAWVHGLLGERLSFFSDEAPDRGARFRGKPVKHPRQLGPEDHLILPYWNSNASIAKRLRKTYPKIGAFLAL